MSGRKSRSKGMRGEYLVRDFFRNLGFKADRVPASGAAQGFKGDVHVQYPGIGTIVVEVKSRKNSFGTTYKLLGHKPHSQKGIIMLHDDFFGTAIVSFADQIQHQDITHIDVIQGSVATRLLKNFRRLIGPADLLFIKDDNKPLIMVEFSSEQGPVQSNLS